MNLTVETSSLNTTWKMISGTPFLHSAQMILWCCLFTGYSTWASLRLEQDSHLWMTFIHLHSPVFLRSGTAPYKSSWFNQIEQFHTATSFLWFFCSLCFLFLSTFLCKNEDNTGKHEYNIIHNVIKINYSQTPVCGCASTDTYNFT